ncbi:MAG: hypothetical protein IJ766_09005, partial [Clostridia bacterium]|nr:hypothetical protein [Clostridia bacterium]
DWVTTIFNGVGAGFCAFSTVYTFGMSAYELYCNFSWYLGYTPVTEIGTPKTSIEDVSISSSSSGQHLKGTGSPKKNATPNGSYTKVDSKGNLYSYTQFDSQGRETLRIDYQGRPHAGVLPHIHMYVYLERGGRVPYTFDLKWQMIE